METKLSEKYQIVVPKAVRQKMDLRAGSRVRIFPLDEKRAVLLKQPGDYLATMRGLGKEVWRKLGGATLYLKKERTSWDKESVWTR